MNRNELPVSDEELIDYLYQGYRIRALKLNFVEVGSFYGFIVEAINKKYFLKIYPHDQSLVPIQPSIESLNRTGMVLNQLRNVFGMNNLSCMIPDIHNRYCFKGNALSLTLFDYIEA